VDCKVGKIYNRGHLIFIYDTDRYRTSLKTGRLLDVCENLKRTNKNVCVSLTAIVKYNLRPGEMVELVKLKPGRIFSYKKKYFIVEECQFVVRLNDGAVLRNFKLPNNAKVRTYKKNFNF